MKKLPEDPRRKQQVKTFVAKYGRKKYRQAGAKGGSITPTQFNSETGRRAVAIREAKRRAAREAEEKRKQDENGPTTN